MQTMTACLPELDRAQIIAIWNDLNNSGILNGEANSLMAMASDNSSPQLKMRLTEFGKDFVAFITVP